MPKRKLSEIEMTDENDDADEICLPTTPVPEKRRRKTSDVIDSLGEEDYVMVTPRSSASKKLAELNTPVARLRSLADMTDSPDQGYSTPNTWRGSIESVDMEEDLEENPTGSRIVRMETELIHCPVYDMRNPCRGKCVVFNHINFSYHNFAPRKGSERDAIKIQDTFEKLRFDVEICHDFLHAQVVEKIEKLASQDHSSSDCICIFVLTHGKDGMLLAKDAMYSPEMIWKAFTADKCKSLAGKPKIFFFQACRGDKTDSGVFMMNKTVPDSWASYKLPNHADFLIAQSTVDGYYSWRNIDTGTWYIQTLCKVFDEYSSRYDLLKLLTIVNRKVAMEFQSEHIDPDLHGLKQIPCLTSMLTKDVYF